ncbi:hypothetical protein C7120_08770 [Prevotella sp. oral taxon 376]|uniref:hypothetical protein n=1 Tax=Prevotella sp. oral taxon 376 TaxID=712466 RepID=UPI000D1EE9F0|nr:hypothetical protein [Prevotella sp. oral taxon 376]PTL34583.1 hypothetical protein C7120_08770 [Prevotella sp. oral taxon 376]
MDKKLKERITGLAWGLLVCMLISMLSGCRTKKAITERMSIESVDTTKTEADSARTIHSVVESTEKLQYTTDFGIVEFANEGGELMIDPDGNIKAHGVKAYRRRRAHHESEKKESSITNDSTRVSNRQANGIRNKVDAETTHEKRLTKWQQLKMDLGGIAMGCLAAAIIGATVWLLLKARRII